MRHFLPFIAISIFFVLVASILGVDYLTKTRVDPVIQRSIIIENNAFSLYAEDLEYLRGLGFFNAAISGVKNGQKDAGPELNGKIGWIPHGPDEVQPHPLVAIAVKEKILRAEKDWIEHPLAFQRDFKQAEFHFEIFQNLANYDYWDIENSGPIAELIKHDRFVPSDHLPAPDSLDLIMVVKARFLQALFDHTELQALKDAHQLAALLLTTESFRLELAAVSILEAERVAYLYYLEKKKVTEADWQPFDANVTRRASRAIRATRGYLRMWTPPELLEKIYLSEQKPIGYCSSINDGIPNEWMLKSMLGTDIPFERSYAKNYKLLDDIYQIAKSHCRLTYLNHVYDHNEFKVRLPIPQFLTWLPYSRKLFGLTYSSAHFEGFTEYQKSHTHAEF